MRTYLKGGDRREQVLDAARRVFSRLGYQDASIAAICSEAGIARGTLYQYFSNKNELFRALLETHLARMQEFMKPMQLGPEAGNVSTRDVRRFLQLRLLLIFHAVREERAIFKIFFTEAQASHARAEDLVSELNRNLVSLISEELETLMQAGLINSGDTRVSAHLIFGGLAKLCFDCLVIGETADLELLARQAADFLTRGLVGKVADSEPPGNPAGEG